MILLDKLRSRHSFFPYVIKEVIFKSGSKSRGVIGLKLQTTSKGE